MIPSNPYSHSASRQHFSGALPPVKELAATWQPKVKGLDKLAYGILKNKESVLGNSHLKFWQDSGTVWLPKFAISRSWLERFEVSFLEFIESAFFYYSAPLSSQHLFGPLMRRMSPDKVSKALHATPIDQLSKEAFRKVAPVKAATAISGIGVTMISGNYGLNFLKNLISSKVFKTTNFSDVVNLSHKPHTDPATLEKEKKVVAKAKRRILQGAVVSAGLVASSLLLARFGAKVPALEKPLKNFLKAFDFQYNPANQQFGLRKWQIYTIIFCAAASYFDAARDKLELKEIASRVPITTFYLTMGSAWVEKASNWLFGRNQPKVLENGKAKNLDKLKEEALKEAQTLLQQAGQPVTREALEARANELFQTPFRTKAKLFLAPLLFGMTVVGLLVTRSIQHFTKKRYEAQIAENLDQKANTNPPLASALPGAQASASPSQAPINKLPQAMPSAPSFEQPIQPMLASPVSLPLTAPSPQRNYTPAPIYPMLPLPVDPFIIATQPAANLSSYLAPQPYFNPNRALPPLPLQNPSANLAHA